MVGTGALVLKAARPGRPVDAGVAGFVGFLLWIFMIIAAILIARFLIA
jgi:hypothetical protein